ncbi:cytidine deaminase [Rubrivirga sp. S365]|uniref:Cytidine deaminase n=1 Tax=Rubrivirga litoralis TaxID=3075598 RepID=A0ABU3BPK0_9BACT|nr:MULTISPECIES: cytidine deaminase [unclassified Rubrivirga]MDT0631193.1 cytidine deaminase [Rubrivirga sp. F394]MDT7856664.1 cytidine deaminase [Rubrivirga sp. S365]
MPQNPPAGPDRLRGHAQAVAARAHVPYSRAPVGAAVLFESGGWLAAPRLENASFPLTISALQGALALAATAGAAPVAAALSRPLTRGERALLEDWTDGPWRLAAPDLAVREGGAAPVVGAAVRLTLRLPPPPDVAGGAALALAAADRAHVPASDFAVGAAVEDGEGQLVVGANVELDGDWSRGLCAERTALVAARAAGLGPVRRLYVACVRAPGGTPCGGCRQVIAELAPDAEVVVWRGTDPPEVTTPAALLPAAFGGERLSVGQ